MNGTLSSSSETDTSPGRAAFEFGTALRRWRLSEGLSLRALAHRVGMAGHGGLAEYEKGRRIPPEDLVLACERVLGVPCGELRELRRRALAERAAMKVSSQRPTTTPAAPPVHAHQLPADVADFTGRERELAQIRTATGGVVVIAGKPGVGKTALAVHASHLLAADYPYAQLYFDLNGVADPTRPDDVLGPAIRAFGISEAQVPRTLRERSGMFRSLLHRQRALVILDDAADEEQVRPLLPGCESCLTLITSRSRLSGLASVDRLTLDVPERDTAVRLLCGIVGRARVAAEPDEAFELTTACGLLPLAVRIAGNRLAARPMWTLHYLNRQLADERNRLAWLKAGDLAVRTAFTVSYQRLGTSARRLFARLSLVPGVDFGPQLAAVVADQAAGDVEHILDELAEASLVEPTATPGRYRMHDLLRLYAGERLHAEADLAEIGSVTDRMVDWLLATASDAGAMVAPPTRTDTVTARRFTDRQAALDWLDAEHSTVFGAAALAADGRTVAVLGVLVWYFELRCAWSDLRMWCDLVRRTSTRPPALMWNCFGIASIGLGEFDDALRCHTVAADVALSTDDLVALADAQDGSGVALRNLDRVAEAVRRHECAAETHRRSGDRWGLATALDHLGAALCRLGRFADALDCHRSAVELMRSLRDRRGEATTTDALGRALSELGRFREARSLHLQAAATLEHAGDTRGAAVARHGLGVALYGLGRPAAALDLLRSAHTVFEMVRDRLWEARTLRMLGTVLSDVGDDTQARSCRQQALMRFVAAGTADAADLRVLLDEHRTPIGQRDETGP